MKLTSYILGLILFMSCGHGYEVSELYVQKIKNSGKSIYEYGAWSTLNDGAKYGKTILDTNESIGIRDAEQMSFDFFLECPTRDTLFLLKLKEGSARIPKYISTEISSFKGFVIKTDYYLYELGTSSSLTYKFSEFRETDDSLIFLGVEKCYFNLATSKNKIGFLKGNVKLVESDSIKGVLERIEIPAFLLKNFNGSTIDKLTVIRNDSLNINGLVYFQFEPKTPINSNEFSDFGIYKKRKIKDVGIIK